MKIALVHDYLREFGGAERVLMALAKIWPRAPIYTAFRVEGSAAGKAFAGREIRESKWAPFLKKGNLYSPLRFLAPWIWKSFGLSDFDLVIASSSWYITRGFRVGPKTKVICYCHTPPRYLYGYPTSVEWQRFWPVRVYAGLVGHFLRIFDYESAQAVDQFAANSENVKGRIAKFYRREAKVIYPPVAVEEIGRITKNSQPGDYFLVVSRLVGAKGIETAVRAARQAGVKLKVVGEAAGLKRWGKMLAELEGEGVEFLGRLPDEELYRVYGGCRAFLALATDEDFGITPVEAMAAGRPVIAYRGGGYLETVAEGKTGQLIDNLEVGSLAGVLKNFRPERFKPAVCRQQAAKFSEERFRKEILALVAEVRGRV